MLPFEGFQQWPGKGYFLSNTRTRRHYRTKRPLKRYHASTMNDLQPGYACINLTLAAEGITTNRGMIQRTFSTKGIAYASEFALSNVQGLLRILQWNVANDIKVFRITSGLFPWASEYRLQDLPHFDEIRSILQEAGQLPVRVSTHPGPFNKLAGSGATLANTIRDLEIHAELFDLMGFTPSHRNKINIHVGGAYGDKTGTLKRFAANYRALADNIRLRLTVENDDKPGLFSVSDLVFDYFHHKLHPGGFSEEEAFHAAYATWPVRPVFHYSSSRKDFEDPGAKKEAHADWVHERINSYGKPLDIILEAKMKELALLRYFGREHTTETISGIESLRRKAT
jgi:UV DNA damage endonuclease